MSDLQTLHCFLSSWANRPEVTLQEMNSIPHYNFFFDRGECKICTTRLCGTTQPGYYRLFIFPVLSLMHVGKGISNAYVSNNIYSFLNIHWPRRRKKMSQWFFHLPYLHLQVAQIHQCLWSQGSCNSTTFIHLEHTRACRPAHRIIQPQAHALRLFFTLCHKYLWWSPCFLL